ncbi:hypothetical protein N5D77_25385 [Comamonas thiooxydans]|uniref:Uncharacterized protein n=1 Tax=Comamonas thiooxydans TaxID=363952 RepID=A0AA42Q5I7_9BURK|nr:hypothetical protein [Comamonas thiooxydans]MDH1337422.1 hypothetical protein [Comamonas thiooxydans]MDH1743525.1 hypothetical protein [Comamonas thiooxydans]MDH1789899.1 hypothetical protein [Comamonas thiooxydans]
MNEAQKLLAAAFAGELDLDADASGSTGVSTTQGAAAPENAEATQAATEAAAGAEAATTVGTAATASAQEEPEGAPIASKSGGYTIPYEKLTEARTARDSAIAEAAQLRAQLEQVTAAQAANLQQAQAEAQARADAGKAPTQADQNLAAAKSLVEGGADASLFGSFSEEDIAAGINKLVSQQVSDQVAARVEAALAPQREALAREQAVTKEQTHTQKILDAHKDAFEVAESKEFASWKSGQPGYMQAAIDHTLQAGNAQDVIDLLGQFKQVHAGAAGAATGDPTAAAVAKALADAKTAPPVSLSSLPGAAPAGTEAERAVALASDPAALLEYMSSLPRDRQTSLMNSVV